MKPEDFSAVLVLPHLRIQNANAVSSPFTWGFPAPSAFTGFTHALQLRVQAQGLHLSFGAVGIVCHQFEPQVYLPPGRRTQVFRLTRNPVDKNGDTVAIVEEGRTHLEVSLVLTVSGDDCGYSEDDSKILAAQVLDCAGGMRLAGGSVMPHPARASHPAIWLSWPDVLADQRAEFIRLRRRLMPGFVLVSREHLLEQHLAQLRKQHQPINALDALLDLCRLNISPQVTPASDTVPESVRWEVQRPYKGWLVPIPVGYAAISPLYEPGVVKNARDDTLPFRFVESVLSLGQWLSPHRIAELPHLLWYHDAQRDAGVYRVCNNYSLTVDQPVTLPPKEHEHGYQ